MEHLEGRQSIFAALQARQRRIELILIGHGSHVDKLEEVIALATELRVAIQHVDRAQLDALAHGATHGGIVAVCSPKPRLAASNYLSSCKSSAIRRSCCSWRGSKTRGISDLQSAVPRRSGPTRSW